MSTSGCPDENAIAGFVQGLLPDAERRRLSEHVDGCPTCSRLLAEVARVIQSNPALGTAPVVQPTLVDPSMSVYRGRSLVGTTVGRYLVQRELGAGAMGTVYLAHDPVLARAVALKVVRPGSWEAGTAASRDRLVREARAMASLAHPNVVAVYDAGELDADVFIAMEYVDGVTLAAWLGGAARRWTEVLSCFLDAAQGLAAAHRLGILHRDFKPANVLVGNDGRTRVGDFGLALAAAGDSRAGAGPTAAGAVIGTPAYMAPEQLFGQPLDARADQYAFCVALYEGLFGQRPFAGSTLDELRFRATTEAARPPRVARGVPGPLVQVLLRGLSARAG